jgi:hypothetical protein
MKENKEKKLDAFIKQLVKEVALEEPSVGFTKKVLSKIDEASLTTQTTGYTPLISKTAWFVVAVVSISLLIIAAYGNVEFDLSLINSDFFTILSESSSQISLPNISFSNVVVYAALAVGFFAYVQIYLLKKSWIQKEVLY